MANQYSAAVKARILSRILVASESPTKVAQDEGINRSTITRWLRVRRSELKNGTAIPLMGMPPAARGPMSATGPDDAPLLMVKEPTDDLTRTVVGVILNWGRNHEAAAIAGVPYSRFLNWLTKGGEAFEAGKDTCQSRFAMAVRKAEAERTQSQIATVKTAASKGDYRAAMFLLQSQYPTRFGRRAEEEAGVGEAVRDGVDKVQGMLQQVLDRQSAAAGRTL